MTTDMLQHRSARSTPFSSLMSWPPHPAITIALIASRPILLLNDLVTCILSFVMASYSISFLVLGIFMSIAMPLLILLAVLEYQMLPRKKSPSTQTRSWLRGRRGTGRYSALGNRDEGEDDDHEHESEDETWKGMKKVRGRNLMAGLVLDLLGMISFVTLYAFTTVDAAGAWYNNVALTYASIGALVAWIVHLCCFSVQLLLFRAYSRLAKTRCPHCNRVMRSYMSTPSEAGSPITPIRLPDRDFAQGALFGPEPEATPETVPAPVENSSANVKGEAENDTLIVKEDS